MSIAGISAALARFSFGDQKKRKDSIPGQHTVDPNLRGFYSKYDMKEILGRYVLIVRYVYILQLLWVTILRLLSCLSKLVEEERSMLTTIRVRQQNWMRYIMRGDSLQREIIERRMESKRGRGRPRQNYWTG